MVVKKGKAVITRLCFMSLKVGTHGQRRQLQVTKVQPIALQILVHMIDITLKKKEDAATRKTEKYRAKH